MKTARARTGTLAIIHAVVGGQETDYKNTLGNGFTSYIVDEYSRLDFHLLPRPPPNDTPDVRITYVNNPRSHDHRTEYSHLAYFIAHSIPS
jgi:hypothetical protein